MLPKIYRSNHFHYPLITDIKRNEFYEKILAKEVHNKVCVEIGFGTGILSFLAIKHGAKHVYAYEMDRQLYEVGRHLIEQLGLSNQITLMHKIFNKSDIPNDCEVVFHEVLGRNLWDEHVYFSLDAKYRIIPGLYFTEFYCCELNESELDYFSRFTDVATYRDKAKQHSFPVNTGIVLDEKYTQTIEQILNLSSIDRDLMLVSQNAFVEKGFYDKELYNLILSRSVKIGEYELDINAQKVRINDKELLSNDLSWIDINCTLTLSSSKHYLILPRFGIGHGNERIYLADCNWQVPNGYCLLKNAKDVILKIRQYLDHYNVENFLTYELSK